MTKPIDTPSFVYGFQGQNFYTPSAPLQQQIEAVCKGLLNYAPFQQMVRDRGLDFQRIEQITGSFVPNQRLLLTIRIGLHYYPFLMEEGTADLQVIRAAAFLANPQPNFFPDFQQPAQAPAPRSIPLDRAQIPSEEESPNTDPDANGVYRFASHSDTSSDPDAPPAPTRAGARIPDPRPDTDSDSSAGAPRRPARDPRRTVRFDVPDSDPASDASPAHSPRHMPNMPRGAVNHHLAYINESDSDHSPSANNSPADSPRQHPRGPARVAPFRRNPQPINQSDSDHSPSANNSPADSPRQHPRGPGRAAPFRRNPQPINQSDSDHSPSANNSPRQHPRAAPRGRNLPQFGRPVNFGSPEQSPPDSPRAAPFRRNPQPINQSDSDHSPARNNSPEDSPRQAPRGAHRHHPPHFGRPGFPQDPIIGPPADDLISVGEQDSPRPSDASGDVHLLHEPSEHSGNSDIDALSEEENLPRFRAQPQGIPAGRLPPQARNIPAAPQGAPRVNPPAPAGQPQVDNLYNALRGEIAAREELQRRLLANEAEMQRLVQHINGPMNQRLQAFQQLIEQRNQQLREEAYRDIQARLDQERQNLMQALGGVNQNVARIEAELRARQDEAREQNQERFQQLQDQIHAHEARIQELQNNPPAHPQQAALQEALNQAEQRRQGLEQQINELRQRLDQLPLQQYQDAFQNGQDEQRRLAEQVQELEGRLNNQQAALNQRIDQLAEEQRLALANQVQQLEARLNALPEQNRQRLEEARGEIERLENRINALPNPEAVEEFRRQFNQLQQQIHDLANGFNVAQQGYMERFNRIPQLEENIDHLRRDFGRRGQLLAEEIQGFQIQLNHLRGEIERIELNRAGPIDELNRRLEQLSEEVRQLRNRPQHNGIDDLRQLAALRQRLEQLEQQMQHQPLPYLFRPFPMMAGNPPRREAPALPAGAPNVQPAAAPQPSPLFQQRWNGPRRSFDESDIGRMAGGLLNFVRRGAPK